jgi:hypothetical protein
VGGGTEPGGAGCKELTFYWATLANPPAHAAIHPSDPITPDELTTLLSIGQVAPTGLAKELFRQLKLSHVLSRMTVVVDEPVQPCPGTLVSDSTRSHSQHGEIIVCDLRTQFLKEPIRCVDPPQELFRLSEMRREL